MDGGMFRGAFETLVVLGIVIGAACGIALWELAWWLARHVSIGWN